MEADGQSEDCANNPVKRHRWDGWQAGGATVEVVVSTIYFKLELKGLA